MNGVFSHWPNRITALRFVGSLLLFVLFAVGGTPADGSVPTPGWFTQGVFWLFITIALTDYLDGYLARRDGLVSAFGRVADPFVDKVLVLGAMIFLAVMPWSSHWFPAWVVVVVLAREFLVTGIRGYVESQGGQFPADGFGKVKMVVQCFAIGFALGGVAFPWERVGIRLEWLSFMTYLLVWATLVTSLASGFTYVRKAGELLGSSD